MGAPTVYKYDDVGAPQTGVDRTCLIDILDACLVDGYGTKPAAGWTKPFENAAGDIACYRNDSVSGTGMFLQVDCITSNYDAYNATIHGYETMSSATEGLERFSDVNTYVRVYNNVTDPPRKWIVIADNRGVYMFIYFYMGDGDIINVQNDQCTKGFYFGDIVSLFDPDPYGCVLISAVNGATNYGTCLMHTANGYNTTTYVGTFIARYISGDVGVSSVAQSSGGGPCPPVPGSSGVDREVTGVLLSRPYLNDGASTTIRGFLPGWYAPCHSYIDFDFLEEVVVEGKTVIAIPSQGNHYQTTYRGLAMIDIGETFRP